MNKKQAIRAINNYRMNGAGRVIAAYIYQVERGKWKAVCHCTDNIGHIYNVNLFMGGRISHSSYDSLSDKLLSDIEGENGRFTWIISPNGTYCRLGYCDEFILISIPT